MRHLLSISASLVLGVVSAVAADAAPELKPIHIEALIDGRSRLVFHGNTAYWYHMEWTCPGRHGDNVDRPTVINDDAWMPKWPDRNGPKNEFGFCESSRYDRLDPPLPRRPLKYTVQDTQARGEVRVLQQPAKANDYTLIVEIMDEEGGSADYVLDLMPEPAEEPAPVKPAAAAALREGLVAEYLLDGDAKDTSGKDHQGKSTDIVPTADRFGRANAAMQFNGKTSFIEVRPAPDLKSEAVSVSAWAKYDTLPEADWNGAILSQDDGRARRVFQLSTNGNRIVWHRVEYGWGPVGLLPIKIGQWYHIAATFDGKDHALYINGVLQQALPGRMEFFPTEPLFIGRKGTDEKQFYFSGAIDDVRIYDRPLKPDEVMALYQEKP